MFKGEIEGLIDNFGRLCIKKYDNEKENIEDENSEENIPKDNSRNKNNVNKINYISYVIPYKIDEFDLIKKYIEN